MKDLYAIWKNKYNRLGASLSVTRSALSLGAQNATTGIYAKSYADTTIQMAIGQQKATTVRTSAGKFTVIQATGVTSTAVVPGDLIKSGLTSEFVSNGSFEDKYLDWTTGGTQGPILLPDEDDGNPFPTAHSGVRFIKFSGDAYVEQTLPRPVAVSSLTSLVRKWHVDSVTPRRIGSDTKHYYCRLSRSLLPVTGGAQFYYCISVPTAYGNGNAKWKLTVTYTDATTTVVNYDVTEAFDANGYTAWALASFIGNLTAGKIVEKIKLEYVVSTHSVFLDDVSIFV